MSRGKQVYQNKNIKTRISKQEYQNKNIKTRMSKQEYQIKNIKTRISKQICIRTMQLSGIIKTVNHSIIFRMIIPNSVLIKLSS
jgi:hypothetical protein